MSVYGKPGEDGLSRATADRANGNRNDQERQHRMKATVIRMLAVVTVLFFFLGGIMISLNRPHEKSTEGELTPEPVAHDASDTLEPEAGKSVNEDGSVSTGSSFPLKGSYITAGELKRGYVVQFGHYAPEGSKEKPLNVRWIVLDVEEDRALLVSQEVLDDRRFSEGDMEKGDGRWKNSSIRKWLNGEFYRNCFTKEERKLIRKVTVKAEENVEHKGTADPGKDTSDWIFLLSMQQFKVYMKGKLTIGVTAGNLTASHGGVNGTTYWWLSTIGSSQNTAVFVNANGTIVSAGADVTLPLGIRPAMYIRTDGTEVCYAGTVSDIADLSGQQNEYGIVHAHDGQDPYVSGGKEPVTGDPDPYGALDFDDPDDFWAEYEGTGEFESYEDAEDYWNEVH